MSEHTLEQTYELESKDSRYAPDSSQHPPHHQWETVWSTPTCNFPLHRDSREILSNEQVEAWDDRNCPTFA